MPTWTGLINDDMLRMMNQNVFNTTIMKNSLMIELMNLKMITIARRERSMFNNTNETTWRIEKSSWECCPVWMVCVVTITTTMSFLGYKHVGNIFLCAALSLA